MATLLKSIAKQPRSLKGIEHNGGHMPISGILDREGGGADPVAVQSTTTYVIKDLIMGCGWEQALNYY